MCCLSAVGAGALDPRGPAAAPPGRLGAQCPRDDDKIKLGRSRLAAAIHTPFAVGAARLNGDCGRGPGAAYLGVARTRERAAYCSAFVRLTRRDRPTKPVPAPGGPAARGAFRSRDVGFVRRRDRRPHAPLARLPRAPRWPRGAEEVGGPRGAVCGHPLRRWEGARGPYAYRSADAGVQDGKALVQGLKILGRKLVRSGDCAVVEAPLCVTLWVPEHRGMLRQL